MQYTPQTSSGSLVARQANSFQTPPFVNPNILDQLRNPPTTPSSTASTPEETEDLTEYQSPPFVNPSVIAAAQAANANAKRDEALAPILGNGVVAGISASLAQSKGHDIFTDNTCVAQGSFDGTWTDDGP